MQAEICLPLDTPALPQLHTLTVELPLTANELAAVLFASPAVEDLDVDEDEEPSADDDVDLGGDDDIGVDTGEQEDEH